LSSMTMLLSVLIPQELSLLLLILLTERKTLLLPFINHPF
jgi:hypothetical protein